VIELVRVVAQDFCVFSELDVELKKQGLVFICADNRDSEGADSNGAGKTTIFKAVTWALFGECVDGDKGDEVIRRGAKKAMSTVSIEDGDTMWHITRVRSKGKPRLSMEREDSTGRHPVEESKELLEERIHNLVGLDFHAFKNTVLYGANDIVKFADPRTRDSDRKGMLHCILRTSVLQDAHRKALDRAKEVREDIAKVDKSIAEVQAAINAVDVTSARKRRDRWDEEHEASIKAETDKAQACRDEAKRIGSINYATDIAAIQARIHELYVERDHAKMDGAEVERLNKELEASRERYGKLQERCAKLEARVETYDEGLEGLKGKSECPMCHSPLDIGHAAKHVKTLTDERANAQRELDNLRTGALKAALVAGQELRKKRDAAMAKVRVASEVSDSIQEAERELKDKERERDASKGKVEAAVTEAKGHLKRAKELRAETNPHKAAYKEARVKVAKLEAKNEKFMEERADLDMTLAHIQFWVKGFSNRGLPSFVLDNVMPLITSRANHYLETLADGDISMDFQTQRELKSAKGEVRDEITIVTTIEGHEGVTPSSGQRTKMNVATDLALMDLVSSREGGRLNLLMLDEVLDGLDGEGTERVLMLLQELRTVKGSVFVISHGSTMAEIFEHGLKVIKEGGSATVERLL
jgi:DNA repair exonuclease SbcCD ATPase subunit